MAPSKRPCGKCGKTRISSQFKTTKSRICTPCQRLRAARAAKDRRLRETYGISIEQYDEMLADQHGVCAICGGKRKVFDVDHDHKTGEVRGLLCRSDNKVLAYVRDNPMRLRIAAEYLVNPPARNVL